MTEVTYVRRAETTNFDQCYDDKKFYDYNYDINKMIEVTHVRGAETICTIDDIMHTRIIKL